MIRIISYTRLLILVLSVGVLFGCSSDIVEQKRQAEKPVYTYKRVSQRIL